MTKMFFKAEERAKASKFAEDLVDQGVVPFAEVCAGKGGWVVAYDIMQGAAVK